MKMFFTGIVKNSGGLVSFFYKKELTPADFLILFEQIMGY